ncbi:MAG TPA: STAS domain-containing protein [bacterium]|nr:STAS domain-containing protein [bacterium]HPN30639.1 STAS domain-containing protein [bacterium]
MNLIKLEENVISDNIENFKSQIDKFFSESKFNMTIDFSKINLICSSGLGVLISALKKSRINEGDIKLIIPESNAEITQIFNITRLNTVFTIYNSQWETD